MKSFLEKTNHYITALCGNTERENLTSNSGTSKSNSS
jgi:hypothetical protein